MSAIAAVWHFDQGPGTEFLLGPILEALQPYGDEGTDAWTSPEVSLGRNLMQLVPEDRFDRQPIWSRDRSACIVADIRLDNRAELAAELGLTAMDERPDVDFLVEAWSRWNSGCLGHLLGAFAFAVWLPASQELFVARDHSGECPVCYHAGDGFFALASMPQGLRALPNVGTRLDHPWIARWLTLQPQGSSTIFQGIESLQPGHWLRVTPKKIEVQPYWKPGDAKPIRFRRNDEYAEGLVEVLDRATRPRLRRIGGLATQLSSGLDSSSVTASAAIMLAESGEDLYAYTSVPQSGFSSESYSKRPVIDEGPFAGEVAALYSNITHIKLSSAGIPLLPTLPALSLALNEPFLNGINALWIAGFLAHARQHGVGVMLQGVIGNATISFEHGASLGQLLYRGKWAHLARHMYTLRRNEEMSYRNSAKAALEGITPLFLQRARAAKASFWNPGSSMINEDFAREQHTAARVGAQAVAPGERYWAARGEFHTRADLGRFNAACRAYAHIDMRDPTGDKRVWEYCYSIPFEQFTLDGHTRSLVRRAMRGRLPDATLDRYRQGRQGADWYMSMREALPALRAEFALIQRSPTARHVLDLPRMKDLLDHFPDKDYGTTPVMNTWKYSLTRGLALGNFLRLHEQAAGPA